MIIILNICTVHHINIKLNSLKLQYLSSLIKLRCGYVVVYWTYGRGDGISKPPFAVWRIEQFVSPINVFVFYEDTVAGPFYLVSISYPMQNKVEINISLTH